MYRTLDVGQIRKTSEALSQRIAASFPDSGLSRVSLELQWLADETEARLSRLRRPDWRLRLVLWSAAALVLLTAVALPVLVSVRTEVADLSDLMQGIEAAVNNVVFVAIAFWFLVTMEQRPKRRVALAALHELRSIAHVVDMHQLTKDPDQSLTSGGAAAGPELGRYLDYCSELLSIVSKLAALYAQHVVDQQVLAAVNDVETLAGGLSSKIWQKIVILDVIALRD